MNAFIYYLLAINLIAFIIMGIDKYKSIHGKWRTREKTMFFIGFLLGGIGIFLGMTIFHHKTRKKQFRYGVPFIILINILIINHILLTWA